MRIAALFTAGLVGFAILAAGPAGADPESGPNTLPAGSTIEPDIDCTPTAAHPNPVVVLPGGDGTTAQTADQWDTVRTILRDAGYCTLLFQGGIVGGTRWGGDIPGEAQQVAEFVAKVRATTGADRVDIVAHSIGTVVANYYLKVLGGAPTVDRAVFLTPEARGCDGAGFLATYGIHNPPVTVVQLLTEFPALGPALVTLAPNLAPALEVTPISPVYQAVFGGPVTQPGVRYSVLSTHHDELATPPDVCSKLDEPGVDMNFYEDLFPDAAPVGHSTLRADANTAGWVVRQLQG